MMQINNQQLINLPVYTQSQDFLGYVISFDIDIEKHCIVAYIVHKHRVINNLLPHALRQAALVINPAQVIAIHNDRVIVRDNIITSDETSVMAQVVASKMPITAETTSAE